ncbi:hypothetical protein WEI85_24295 [Actinomycetes bacterium KLBMP 9797]
MRRTSFVGAVLALTLVCVTLLVIRPAPAADAPAPAAAPPPRVLYAGTDHRGIGVVRGEGGAAVTVPFLADVPGHFDDEPAARGGAVTWVSRRDAATTEVYLRRDGGAATRVTRNGTDESRPVLSPDGTRIAFSSGAGRTDGGHDIFVINTDGTGERRVTDGTGDNTWPTWSPDGTRLGFTGRRGGDPVTQIYCVPPDGGPIERITAEQQGAGEPAWDPDAGHNRLAYTVDPGGTPRIWLIAPNGTGRAPVLLPNWQSRQASWTADGSTVAFVSPTTPDGAATGPADLVYSVVVREDPCTCVVVLRLAENRAPSHPTWYGDSLLVARTSAADRDTATLQDIRPDGSDPRDLGFPILDQDPRARTDSRFLFEPTDGDPWFERQVYSPDGRRIAATRFDTVDGVRVERIWILNADGSQPRLLPIPHRRPGDWEFDPAWSPDGTKLALVRNAPRSAPGEPPRTVSRIEVIDVATGALLLNLPMPPQLARFDDTQPAWSPDGTRLAFTRGTYRGSELTHIWTANASDGRRQTDLTATVCGSACRVFDDSAAFAPDGVRIAFNRELDGLALTHVDGSGCRMLFPSTGASCAAPVPAQERGQHQPRDVAWAPDGDAIVFSARRAADNNSPEALRIYDLATGAVRPLTDALPGRQKEPSWQRPEVVVPTPSSSPPRTPARPSPTPASPSPNPRVRQPRIVAVPPIGPPGFVTLIRGTDFPPGVPVRLSWNVGITAAAAPVLPGPDGTFAAQLLVLPKDRIGARLVRATGTGFAPVSTPFLVTLPAQQPPKLLERRW